MEKQKEKDEIVAFQIIAREWRKRFKQVKFGGHHNNGRPIVNAKKRRRKATP